MDWIIKCWFKCRKLEQVVNDYNPSYVAEIEKIKNTKDKEYQKNLIDSLGSKIIQENAPSSYKKIIDYDNKKNEL